MRKVKGKKMQRKKWNLRFQYKILVLLFLSSICLLNSQINDVEILKKQARRLESRRQYEMANEMYHEILKIDPTQFSIVEKIIQNLLRDSKIEEANSLLKKYKQYFRDEIYVKNEVLILLRNNESQKTIKKINDYLKQNKKNVNLYRIFGQVLERNAKYEDAIEIYLKARKINKDDKMYAIELARCYERFSNFEYSIKEYLVYLEMNKSYRHLIQSRFRKFLDEDSKYIKFIGNYAETSLDVNVREVYAISLMQVGRIEEALRIYSTLDPKQIFTFASEQLAIGNYEIALTAFQEFLSQSDDVIMIANTKVKIGELYIKKLQLDLAKTILMEVYNQKEITNRKYRHKTQAGKSCREMLAEIIFREQGNEKIAFQYLNEAKSFSFNYNEKKELDFKIIHYLIMTEKYDDANNKLIEILKNEKSGSKIESEGFYFSFLLASMKNETAISDSMLNNMIVRFPEDDFVSEALTLAVLKSDMGENDYNNFLKAYRLEQVFRSKNAIEKLQKIYSESQNEDLLLLAGDWAISSGNLKLAKDIFSMPIKDEMRKGYAILKLASIENDTEQKNILLKNSLKEIPHSVFSPSFRTLLSN